MTRLSATPSVDRERGVDFDACARRHYADILAYLRSRTRNPEAARDLAQETFLQAYRSRRRFDPGRGDAREWLFGIARHVSASEARRGAALPTLRGIIEGAWHASPETSGDDARLSALGHCLGGLASRTRDVLRLVYDEALSHAEVAARLGLAPGAVKVAACRARQALADCIRRRLGGRR